MAESSDELIRREAFQKPGRQECADWDAQLNQAILATDIREGWEGVVELFNRLSWRMRPPIENAHLIGRYWGLGGGWAP